MSLSRLSRLFIVILILLGAPAFAQDTPAPSALTVKASGGFSGWAVPLPDYAAHIIVRGDAIGGSTRMVYGDVSLTPVRVVISGNAAETPCTISINNRTSTLRLPAAAAFMVEPSVEKPEDNTPDTSAGLIQRYEVTVPAGGGEFWFPVPVYPQPSDLTESGVEVEVQAGGAEPVKSPVTFRYFPRGRLYGCLLESPPRGVLAAVDIGQVVGMRAKSGAVISGYNQKFQLVSTSPEDIGPDYRVLRHFAIIAVTADDWNAMPERVRGIVSDAAALGSRLVIFGATGAVTVGKHSFAPSAEFAFAPIGYGDIAITPLPLEGVEKRLAEEFFQKLSWAHNLGLGMSSRDIGQQAVRDVLYRNALGQGFQYSWMISMSDVVPSKRSLNPAWVYDYLTRAGMLHPLDSMEFHWQSVGLGDVSRELVDMSTNRRDTRPIHWVIDYNLRRSSARALSNAAIVFTMLTLTLAGVCFARRCRYIVLAGILLAVSVAAAGFYALRIDFFHPGSINGLQLTSTIASADTETAEVRSVSYAYSAYSTDCAVTGMTGGQVLSRISPLQADTVDTGLSRGGDYTIGKLHLEPLLPTEFSTAYTAKSAPLTGMVKAIAEDERLLELQSGADDLRFVFLVYGTRVLFIGDIPANSSRVIVVPAAIGQSNRDPEMAVSAARTALADLYRRESDSMYAGNPSALPAVGLASMAEVLSAEVLRQLVADGRGITLTGLRAGESALQFGRNTGRIPKVDLFVYKLQ